MTTRFGVDEAGKGPVLGPMVVAAVSGDPAVIPEGVADSKRLSAARREELAAELHAVEGLQIATVQVSVAEIDDEVSNLNVLTAHAHGAAVAAVADEGMPGCADAADIDIERYAHRVEEAVGFPVDLDAKHKADEYDVLVAAASIVAKVERDAVIAELQAEHGDIGSGYPSDPKTREFLKLYFAANGEFPPETRVSWKTCASLRAEVEQQGLSNF